MGGNKKSFNLIDDLMGIASDGAITGENLEFYVAGFTKKLSKLQRDYQSANDPDGSENQKTILRKIENYQRLLGMTNDGDLTPADTFEALASTFIRSGEIRDDIDSQYIRAVEDILINEAKIENPEGWIIMALASRAQDFKALETSKTYPPDANNEIKPRRGSDTPISDLGNMRFANETVLLIRDMVNQPVITGATLDDTIKFMDEGAAQLEGLKHVYSDKIPSYFEANKRIVSYIKALSKDGDLTPGESLMAFGRGALHTDAGSEEVSQKHIETVTAILQGAEDPHLIEEIGPQTIEGLAKFIQMAEDLDTWGRDTIREMTTTSDIQSAIPPNNLTTKPPTFNV